MRLGARLESARHGCSDVCAPIRLAATGGRVGERSDWEETMRHFFWLFVALVAATLCFGISSASAMTRTSQGGVQDRSLPPQLILARASTERAMLQGMRADAQRASRAAAWEARDASNYHVALTLTRADAQGIVREAAANVVDFSQRRVSRVGAVSLTSRRLQAGMPPTCDGRPATIVGTEGNDTIKGTPGRDVIVGLGGDDQIYG